MKLGSLVQTLCGSLLSFSLWASDLTVEAINVLTHQTVRENPLNPGNFLDISELRNETALIAQGQVNLLDPEYRLPINLRLRGSYLLEESGRSSREQVDVQELSVDYLFADNWVINAGKTQLAWDNATSAQPLGFFQRDVNLLDLTDAQSRSEGLPLVALSYLARNWSTTLVYSHDAWSGYDGFNRGLEQWALQFRMTNARLDWTLAAQKPQGQQPGLGAAFSYTWTDNMVVHGSGFIRKGTRRPFNTLLNNSLSNNPQPGLVVENPIRSERRGDDNYYLRYVIGANLNIDRFSVLLEYSHDERGLTDPQWNRFTALADLHNGVFSTSSPNATNADNINNLALLNMVYDNQTIVRSGTRQNYVFSQIRYVADWADIAGFARVETGDASTTWGVSVGKELSANASLSLSAFAFKGNRRSEFGLLPIKNSVEAVLRYYF